MCAYRGSLIHNQLQVGTLHGSKNAPTALALAVPEPSCCVLLRSGSLSHFPLLSLALSGFFFPLSLTLSPLRSLPLPLSPARSHSDLTVRSLSLPL